MNMNEGYPLPIHLVCHIARYECII